MGAVNDSVVLFPGTRENAVRVPTVGRGSEREETETETWNQARRKICVKLKMSIRKE